MELPLAGIDVVEVAPPYDHAEITAFLAGRVVLEALSGIAWRRRRLAGQPCASRVSRCCRAGPASPGLSPPAHPASGGAGGASTSDRYPGG